MTAYTWYTKVTHERIYEVSLPTNFGEVHRMLTAIENEWREIHGDKRLYDSDITVESDGEKLQIKFLIGESTRPALSGGPQQVFQIPLRDVVDDEENPTTWRNPVTGKVWSLERHYQCIGGDGRWRWAGGFEDDLECNTLVPLMCRTDGRGGEMLLTTLSKKCGLQSMPQEPRETS